MAASFKVRGIVWVLLYSPLVFETVALARGNSFYGEYLHLTGLVSLQLLLVTLAIRPLCRFFGNARWPRFLLRIRRDLGIAVFVYAAAHTWVWLDKQGELARIAELSIKPDLLTGWLAMLVFTAAALTSSDVAMRAMGRGWRRLHKLVYPAAILTVVHWILTAFDPTQAYVYLGVLVLVLAPRVLGTKRSGQAL